MEEVVTDGTAKRAAIDGFTVAGKTGTAQKLINGRYSHSDHYASFVGFVPSRNPALAMVVVIDSAKGPNGDHGGAVAAPIFKRIAEASLRYLGVPPTVNPLSPVLVARGGQRSDPPADPATTTGGAPSTVTLVVDGPSGTVPDVRGMSAREAVRKLVNVGLNARASGSGVVVSQVPAPGEPLDAGGVCRLTLERPVRRTGQ
jgi:cell division protein FtsI (penicillin-binding protein 3)